MHDPGASQSLSRSSEKRGKVENQRVKTTSQFPSVIPCDPAEQTLSNT
jgi:hypothetical protein